MVKYKDLIYLSQRYGADIFMDVTTGSLKVYRHEMSYDVSPEEKKAILKILKLYKKIPSDYEKLRILPKELFEEIWDRRGDYSKVYWFISEELGVPVSAYYEGDRRYMVEGILRKYSENKIPRYCNRFNGGALNRAVQEELENAIEESKVNGVYVLKKLYNKHKRKINKYGLDEVLGKY